MLSAAEVVKRYDGKRVLDDVSLSVEQGEFMALIGESGAGKTTLLRLFNRTVDLDEGRVSVAGKDVRHVSPFRLRRSMGFVQQEGGLLPHWTVQRNVALVPTLLKRKNSRELATKALNRVGLPPEEFAHRLPRELSGGQRQRVALARALAANPEIVLLDEPFRALDAITRAELVETVRKVLKEVGVTALIVTHDLMSAIRIADRIAVLRAGRVEQCATAEEIAARPATPYVAELLQRAGVSAP